MLKTIEDIAVEPRFCKYFADGKFVGEKLFGDELLREQREEREKKCRTVGSRQKEWKGEEGGEPRSEDRRRVFLLLWKLVR